MTKVLKNVEHVFTKKPPEGFKASINFWYAELGFVMERLLITHKMNYGYNSEDYNIVTIHPETAVEYGIGMLLLKEHHDIIKHDYEFILDEKMEKDIIKLERYVHSPYGMNAFIEKTLKNGEIDITDVRVEESPQLINISILIK